MPKVKLENRIFDPAETMGRDELKKLQLSRLRETAKRVQAVPFYREAFKKNKLAPEDIKSLDDLRRLPFTTKTDMRDNYPLGLMAAKQSEIARVHGSSGTTGKPTFVAYNQADLQMWAGLCARFLVAGGLRPEHMVQTTFGMGLFTGGFGLHYGIERVGASVVPAAGGNTERQIMLLQDLKADAIVGTPSYALNVAEAAAGMGIDPKSFNLKFGFFGAEMWTDDLRKRLEEIYDIHATNNYGLSEVIGPGVSGECAARDGMHISEDHFLVECLNPETLAPVKPGELGELVFTSLTKEAMPIIRYRTRDLASLNPEPCKCGRTGVRMSRVTGRSDDMMIIRGVNVFPSQVEVALLRVEGAAPQYVIELTRPGALDEATVKVEVTPETFSDKMSNMQELKARLDHAIHSVTGVRMNIELVGPMTLERSVGKAKRVIDLRGK